MANLFYRNPRLLILTVSLILVAGLSSYYILPRMEDPMLTQRVALVHTHFPGADPKRVESLVTDKLEEELREIEEIKELRSNSVTGISTITIELRDDVDEVASVWSRVRNKLDDAAAFLPAGASEPEFEDVDVKAYALIVALEWKLDDVPNYSVLRRNAEHLKDLLKNVRGTEDVDLFGDPDEEIVVEVDSARLAAMGLTVNEVSRQVGASDAKRAAGQMRGRRDDLLLEVGGEFESLQRIQRTPIHYGAGGRFVPLSDVARIRKGIAQPASSLALIDGAPAVVLGVHLRSDQRIDHWSERVNELLDDYRRQLPQGVGLKTVFAQSGYVEARLDKLLGNLAIGSFAVVGVIFVLMGWRSAVTVGVTLPLAALMVLTGLRFLEIPIHQMSVTGLIIALGLLIDNAIVIVDEVGVKLRDGKAPADAVSSSVRHLAVPLFGSTLTTALAFAPIALMPGPAGEFVGSIAVSVVLAIASSLFLAMTVVPALAAVTQGSSDERAGATQPRWWRSGYSSPTITAWYRRALAQLFKRPLMGVALSIVLPVAGLIQARQLPEQFFPPADRDQFQIELELPAQNSISDTLSTANQIREAVMKYDQVSSVDWFLGESAPTFYYNLVARRKNNAHYAQALVQLKSAEGSSELIHQVQRDVDSRFRRARVLVRQLEQGPPFDAPVEIRLYGPDLDHLQDLGQQIRRLLSETPDVLHTRADLAEALPKVVLNTDEEQARLAGLDHSMMAAQLDATLEGAVSGSVLEETEELPVRVRVSGPNRGALDRITSLDLMSPHASPSSEHPGIPLTALARVDLSAELAAVPRFNGRRMNEVKAYLPAGVLPAKVLADFQTRLKSSDFELPPGYSLEYGGEAAKRDEAVGNLMANVGILTVLMIATLVLSFQSFRVASIIGVVAALSVGLALGALWLFGHPFGFMAIIGAMGLVGVAINDAIVVTAAIRENPEARQGDPEAIREVIVRSTRHVVATSLTTMAGFAPLVVGGGGFWPPLAVAIAGGVGGATILALTFVPCAYLLLLCPRSAAAPATLRAPCTWFARSSVAVS